MFLICGMVILRLFNIDIICWSVQGLIFGCCFDVYIIFVVHFVLSFSYCFLVVQ